MLKPRKHRVLLSALLFALLVRAMIPAGFMPAANFSFQICPDGYPAHLLPGASPIAASNADTGGHHAHHEHASFANDAPPAAGHAHASTPADVAPAAGQAQSFANDASPSAGHAHGATPGDVAPAAGNAHASLTASHAGHEEGAHRHASAGTEHCAFAAVATAFALSWFATFSAPAAIAQAPEFIYRSPAIAPVRFRVPQPRGPPALS